MSDMIQKGFWVVLPYEDVRHLPGLRLSPLGVVPQRERRPRIIVDYTFHDVNEETMPAAPAEAMQFGRALDRILLAILRAPEEHGPVYLLKVDLSDGFYRIPIRATDVAKLGVIYPTAPDEPKLVAFPLVLPMGWTESPPWFCTGTETIVDMANSVRQTSWNPPRHRLEEAASSPPTLPDDGRIVLTLPTPPEWEGRGDTSPLPDVATTAPRPYDGGPAFHADVFVDDEILVGQGPPSLLNRHRRRLLHLNDMVFRPNDEHDNDRRQEPVSLKKLGKGDACWATYKTILGWDVDTIRKTIELPLHRRERLLTILEEVRGRRRITVTEARKLLGEIRSMLLAVSGGSGFLSHLQFALRSSPGSRVRLNRPARDQIETLYELAKDVTSRPTRIAELFPMHPAHARGTCDASGTGAGGVWFASEELKTPPIFWRVEWPNDIQARLVSFENPNGDLTNSDLELAGTILQEGVLGAETSIAEKTIFTAGDNTASIAWRHKGSNSLDGPSAYLLGEASLQQRRARHVPRTGYIPGDRNVLADHCSRRHELSDAELLTLLTSLAPQVQPWQVRRPPPDLLSRLISALRRQRRSVQLAVREPEPPTPCGPSAGYHSWATSESKTLSSPASPTKSRYYVYSPKDYATGDYPVAVNQSDLRMYETKSFTSRRRSPNWGPLTHGIRQPA